MSDLKPRESPLWHFNACIDVAGIVSAHENHDRKAIPDHLVNYLGVAINAGKFFPQIGLPSIVEGPPIPANWHADMAEFGGALRAVDLAGPTFTMIELGCGWGCWMNITGAAARQAGKTPYLMGVEADESHIGFASESLSTNGFSNDQFKLFRGIAAASSGRALFPLQSGGHWGLSPIFGVSAQQEQDMLASGKYEALDTVALSDIIGSRTLDLLHMDIQGGETELVRSCLDVLRERVAYIVIGTHSREIEGELFKLLSSQGHWALEIERPAILHVKYNAFATYIDGVQAWRNTALRPVHEP
jgi:hypothetical protein